MPRGDLNRCWSLGKMCDSTAFGLIGTGTGDDFAVRLDVRFFTGVETSPVSLSFFSSTGDNSEN